MSSSIIPVFVLLLQLYCFFPGISSLDNTMEENPEVETKWETKSSFGSFVEGVDTGNGIDFEDDTITASPIVSQLFITCSAHYPIQWTFELLADLTSFPFDDPPIAMTSLRTSEDFYDTKTYKFYAYLHLRGSSNKITGWYKCSSPDNETLSVSRYIFWQGTESKGLLLGELPYSPSDDDVYSYSWSMRTTCTTKLCLGKPSFTIKADIENKTIVIPCATSYPSAAILLYQKKDDLQTSSFQEIKWRNETIGTGISFDPRIGFTLQVQQLSSPYGIYKCKSQQEADSLIVKVAEGLQKPEAIPNLEVNNTLVVPAKFSYDGKTQTIVCCSSGARAPRIYSGSCRRIHDSFSQSCENIKIQLKDFKLFNRGAMEHSNCRQFPITDSEGIFRCFGPGIDITRQYYIQPTNSTLIYFDDEIPRITKEDMIQVSPTEGDIYHGCPNVNSTLSCHPSSSMFSFGVRWSILWKNGTVELFPEMTSYNHQPGLGTALQFIADKNMTAAICHAPLSNSLEWIDKKIQLNITDPVPPVISGLAVQEYFVISAPTPTSPFMFACKVEGGNPPPEITWVNPSYDDHDRYLFWRTIHTVTLEGVKRSIVAILADNVYLFGNYTCSAKNIAGTTTKIFMITRSGVTTTTTTTPTPGSTDELPVNEAKARINEPPVGKGWTTFEIISISIGCVLLLIGIGVGAMFFLKRRQRMLEEQNSLSYRDLKRNEIFHHEDIDE